MAIISEQLIYSIQNVEPKRSIFSRDRIYDFVSIQSTLETSNQPILPLSLKHIRLHYLIEQFYLFREVLENNDNQLEFLQEPLVLLWIKLYIAETGYENANLGRRVKSQPIVTDKATLRLTILASFKSSTKDLRSERLWDEKRYTTRVICTQQPKQINIIRNSRVSSLEAFSYYPTHGSFATLSSRTMAFTGYASQRFLSYWVAILAEWQRNSRIKLTCLATV